MSEAMIDRIIERLKRASESGDWVTLDEFEVVELYRQLKIGTDIVSIKDMVETLYNDRHFFDDAEYPQITFNVKEDTAENTDNPLIVAHFDDILERVEGRELFGEIVDVNNYKMLVVAAYCLALDSYVMGRPKEQ